MFSLFPRLLPRDAVGPAKAPDAAQVHTVARNAACFGFLLLEPGRAISQHGQSIRPFEPGK